jgi:hypothetical protein
VGPAKLPALAGDAAEPDRGGDVGEDRKEDEDKKSLYERLGVKELILFDPYGEYLQPRLQGYRHVAGRYQLIPLKADGSLLSRTTNLFLEPEGDRLRLVDAETRERLVWLEEIEPAFCVKRVTLQAEEALAAEETPPSGKRLLHCGPRKRKLLKKLPSVRSPRRER